VYTFGIRKGGEGGRGILCTGGTMTS
jgi:hypothetical protein